MDSSTQSPKYIVGIGASAGGLEALERFFSTVPSHPDIAYVVIQHLSPDFKSMMPQILGRVTHLPLFHIQSGMAIEPNTIYLNIPRHDVKLESGRLFLTPTRKASTAPRPINLFFNSLATDLGSRAIGIILSGSGQDGTEGIQAISEAGGLALTQDLESSIFSSMPKSAAHRLSNPIILVPEEMPNLIVSNVADPGIIRQSPTNDPLESIDENALTFLISTLRRRFEIDFTRYKPFTLFRRLDSRIHQLGLNDLAEYSLFIKDNSEEQNALYRDLLIDVTSFFRDEEAFHIIKHKIIPNIVAEKHDHETIRIWVAACATGEEAYSIAILLQEEIEKEQRAVGFKIFATDAHPQSISIASDGIYSEKRLAVIPLELQNKYFTAVSEKPGSSQISSQIRSKVVFAAHNLLENPHFSQLDMVSCRNFLIYVDGEAQDEILFRFHIGLKIGGILFLGPSEHLKRTAKDYDTVNNQWRVFRKISSNTKAKIKDRDEIVSPLPKYMQQQARFAGSKNWETRLLQELVDTGYVVDGQGVLKEVFGNGRKYLQFKTGKIALNLTNLLTESLAIPIRTGLQMAQQQDKRINFHAVNLTNSDPSADSESEDDQYCTIDIIPFQGSNYDTGNSGKFYLISIAEIDRSEPSKPLDTPSLSAPSQMVVPDDLSKISSLERELTFTRESLQATIEEMQSSNEELQSANEEMQSTNEELSSVNEELFTVNSEFQEQNQMFTQLNNHMRNMLAASRVIIILLDNNFVITGITPYAQHLFNILETDIGRSILHFNLFRNIEAETLQQWYGQAKSGIAISDAGVSLTGKQLKIQISQYLSEENEVNGLILYFSELTEDIKFLEKIYPIPPIFEKLSREVPSLILVQNTQTQEVVFSGGPLLEQLGYSKAADINTFQSLLHPDDGSDLNSLVEELEKVSGPEVLKRTTLLKNSDGEAVLCKVSEGVYQRSETGDLLQSIAFITPIDHKWVSRSIQG